MNKKLPARPNLDHLKGQAKSLLSNLQKQDASAISAFAEHHPDQPQEPKLADAQLVVARQNGFSSWPKLVHYVECLRDLEGTWAFASLEIEGNSVPPESMANSRLVINGDRFNMLSPEADYIGFFDIDVETMPHTIDIDFVEGPEAGNSSYGIFELDGNDLKICLGLTGARRPTEFVARPGTQHALETLKRVSQDAPVTEPNISAISEKPEAPMGNMADFEAVTPEMEALQGDWLPIEVVNNGAPLPKQFLSHGIRNCTGSHVTVTFGGQKMVDAFFRIAGRGQMDYIVASGPRKGQLQYGIYKFEDGLLTICFAEPGLDRPAEFTSEPGSCHTLTAWRKK